MAGTRIGSAAVARTQAGVSLLLAFVAIVWGANYTISTVALKELDVVEINALRFLLAGPLLLLATGIQERELFVHRRWWPRLVLSSAIGIVAYQLAFTEAIKLTSPAESSILIALSPFATIALARVAGEETPTRPLLIGAAVAFVGVTLVVLSQPGSDIDNGHAAGDVVAAVAGLLWALYAVITRPLVQVYSPLRVTAWAAILGGVVLGLLSVQSLRSFDVHAHSPGAWLSLGYNIVLVTAFGLVAWYAGLRRIGSARSMVFTFLIPAAAAVFPIVVGLARPVPAQLAGVAIVLVGIACAQFATAR